MQLQQIPVTIDYAQVLRYLGTRGNQPVDHEITKLIKDSVLIGKSLLSPAAVIEHFPSQPAGEHLLLGDSFYLPMVDPSLNYCNYCSVVAVTVGETIDQRIEKLFAKGEATQSVILDAVGTVAVEEAANRIVSFLSHQQRVKGLYPSVRLAPGYRGFPLHYLPKLLSIAGGKETNISCNEHYQMKPVKSLCFIIGWGNQPCDNHAKCSLCDKIYCQFRVVSTEGESGVVL